MKILILEDDRERMKYLWRRFEYHTVYHAEHAADAIWLLKEVKFDLICLDHDLGGTQMNYNPKDCGTMVAEYLSVNPIESQIIIHSFNAVAAQRMMRLLPQARYIPGFWMGEEGIGEFSVLDGQSG